MSRIDASTTAIGGLFQLYKYEPFANSFSLTSNAPSGDTLVFTGSSPELFQFLTNPTTRDISFSSANGPSTSYSTDLDLIVTDLSGTLVMETLCNKVRISPGRFLSPPSGTSYVFYKNEPLSVTYPAGVSFVGSIPIQQPVPAPSLPIGLSWQSNSPTTYSLVGTPTIQTASSNYNIIGSGTGGRIITTRATIAVNLERMLVDVSGSTNVTGLTIGTPMTERLVSVRVPPYSPSSTLKVRYTWTALPSGFSFVDANGNPALLGYVTTDASSSIRLTGTLTSNVVRSFSNTPYTITLTPTRTISPFLTSNVQFTLTPAELVLFDVPTVSPFLYTGVPVTASASSNRFRARTQFATIDSSIVSIASPDLRSDLSLAFFSNLQYADLVGTPTFTGSASYTIRATNAFGVSADISVPIAVANDSIAFDYSVTPTTDVCASFILSRDIANAKAGYYTAPLRFRAVAGSGCNVTMSTSSLLGTGLSLTSNAPGLYTLTGVPGTVTPLQTLTVTATAAATLATADTSMSFEIGPDAFTFSSPTLAFVENVAITPVQFTAQTLSERPIVQFSSTDLPTGLSLTTSGLLSGTPLVDASGSFTVSASTGFTSGSQSYSYSLTPDSVLLFTEQSNYTYNPGDPVSIPVVGVSYSGTTVSNYQFSNFNPTLGLSIGSTTGLIAGTLTSGLPPDDLLPISSNFDVTAVAGILDASLGATISTENAFVNRWHTIRNRAPPSGGSNYTVEVLAADVCLSSWSSNRIQIQVDAGSSNTLESTYQATAFLQKNTTVDENIRMATLVPLDRSVVYENAAYLRASSNQVLYTLQTASNSLAGGSSLVHLDGTSTWWMAGVRFLPAGGEQLSNEYAKFVSVAKSTDDGLTWSTPIDASSDTYPVYTRDWYYGVYSGEFSSYYTTLGTALAYKDGVLLVGGTNYLASAQFDETVYTALRSTDDGATWSTCTGLSDVAVELATFNTEGPVWIAAGSGLYSSADFGNDYTTSTTTLWYSDTSGSSWTPVVTGGFDFIGYNVAYGSNTWIASGTKSDTAFYWPQLQVSTDGSNWSEITQVNTELLSNAESRKAPMIGVSQIFFDGSWSILTFLRETVDFVTAYVPYLFTHGPSNLTDTNWVKTAVTLPSTTYDSRDDYVGLLDRAFVRTGTPTRTTFSFPQVTTGGPVVTAPTARSFLFYQYMPITPIVFSATGTGQVYFFLDSNTLPQGLTWNPLTQTISGQSARLGDVAFTVYARDDIAITPITIQTTTIIPRIIRQQDGAGAYTSLVRQYTVVAAAQNARDNRVFPTQERMLGEFAAPPAPDSVTPSNCECK